MFQANRFSVFSLEKGKLLSVVTDHVLPMMQIVVRLIKCTALKGSYLLVLFGVLRKSVWFCVPKTVIIQFFHFPATLYPLEVNRLFFVNAPLIGCFVLSLKKSDLKHSL